MKKYLFDQHDFDQSKIAERDRPVYSEEQLELARSQSYAQGKSDGLKEAKQGQEEQMLKCLARVMEQAQGLIADEERREVEKMAAATKLAMQVAHKLLPQFAQRFSLPEIERVILAAIESRRDEARIAVTIPTVHLDALKGRIDALSLEKGHAGKLILIADDNLAPTDCRVEWADGGAERLYERLFSQIENEFAKAIAGMQSALDADKKQV